MKKNNRWFTLLLVLIFVAGAGIRLYDLTDEPLETHMARQLRSLLISRSLYQGEGMGGESLIEPPIIELLSAGFYRIAGAEIPWVQRLISISFWMLGAWALFDLAKTISGRFGGLFSLVFYLFMPFSILYSRLMMPDPMMTAGTVLAVWALLRWERRRTIKSAVLAGLLTGYAILTKSVAGFVLLPAFALFTLHSMPLKKLARNRQIWMIVLLTALPSLLYYIYGMVILGTLGGQFQGRFFLNLLSDPAHYLRWINVIKNKFGLGVAAISIMSIALVKEKKYQQLLAGWWLGYVLYGLVFAYHIWTHDYYQLPLLPVIALSLAPLGELICHTAVEKTDSRWLGTALLVTGLLVYALPNIWNTRVELARNDYRQEAKNYLPVEEALTEHLDEPVISISADYNTRLEYFTRLEVDNWPVGADFRYNQLSGKGFDFDQAWDQTIQQYHYFIVLSEAELNAQPDLADKLNQAPVFYQGGGVTIYDLTALSALQP
ncbi:MAG: glycosyltransferase family 39 protein [Anaerolineales bacterium]|nr:glycosyltransferase family 39 protein [Anaerolineales bacterium]